MSDDYPFDLEKARVAARGHQGLHGDSQFIKGARWQALEFRQEIVMLREANQRLADKINKDGVYWPELGRMAEVIIKLQEEIKCLKQSLSQTTPQ